MPNLAQFRATARPAGRAAGIPAGDATAAATWAPRLTRARPSFNVAARPRGPPAILTLVYLAFATLGAGYIVVSSLLGHGLDTDSGPGGEHAADTSMDYGTDGSGHGTALAGDHAPPAFHFPFFSPLALAALLGSVGAWGLIALRGFRTDEVTSLLIAVPAALATSYLVTYATWRVVQSSTGSSEIRLAQLRGARGEVLTPVPAGGVGEVALMVANQRFNAPAREEQGRPVGRGQLVVVKDVAGATVIVSAAPPEGNSR